MKIKRATFFYNTNLLNAICSGEDEQVLFGHCFTDTLSVGDSVKFIGEGKSAIVKVIHIEEKDCNGNCRLTIKLLKVIPGELEIDY